MRWKSVDRRGGLRDGTVKTPIAPIIGGIGKGLCCQFVCRQRRDPLRRGVSIILWALAIVFAESILTSSLLTGSPLTGSLSASEIASVDQAVTRINALLARGWERDGVTPARVSGDSEFCRRIWLDLAGVAPPVAEVRSFLLDARPHKREELIDRLLRSSMHARHMAGRWNDILLPDDLGPQSRANVIELNRWLRTQFSDNIPYDHLVGRFLTAGGDGNSGPAIFYTAHSLAPEKIASATSRIFLGLQLQCAQCHDHPFDRWTQDEFWSYAAFFGQLESRQDRRSRTTLVIDRPGREVHFPDSDRVMQPRYPGIKQRPDKDPADNRRRQLTIWLASRDNPYFARAAVNRAWGHLFARGIVDPVDAMDADNPASHPELLAYLADYFVDIRFDLRLLYATLARTNAYQLTSIASNTKNAPAYTFATMRPKTLTPQQYYDSLVQNVLRQSLDSDNSDSAMRNVQREQFLSRMRAGSGSPDQYPHGIVQALGLLNGPEIGMATTGQNGLLVAIEAPFLSDRDRIETLFLATLSRLPTQQEFDQCLQMIDATMKDDSSADRNATERKSSDWQSSDRDLSNRGAAVSNQKAAALGDILWALLNTAECAVSP
tara:strand:- start:60010 stop:61824 length:1815 start_codon:yes stop_codon:yes gene_type:complete